MTRRLRFRYCAILITFGVTLCGAGRVGAQPGTSSSEGLRVFKSANCVGCHKWSGEGGGGYGGAAANLRVTSLTLEQIVETVRCGRPATGMPHFEADAYSDGRCYGLKTSDLPSDKMPPEPDHPLRPADIRAVAQYVMVSIKGRGDPDVAQCQAFFGSESRVCNHYALSGDSNRQNVAASADTARPQAAAHPKVEAAADANAAKK